MKKYAIVSATVLFVFAVVVFVSAGEVSWQDMSAGISGVNSVLIHPVDPRIIYTATDKGVFLSRDSGANWRNVLFTRGSSRRVNQLSFYPGDDDKLYAATENGFFYSPDRGKSWKRIFRGKNYLENACVAAIVLPSGIFLGTRAGLFISKDNGKSWYKRGADLGKSNILAIACGRKDPATIYVVCARGLYISRDAGLSWKRVFLSRLGSDAQSEEEPEDDEGGSDSDYPGHCAVESDRQGNIYLAISARLYKSQDQGVSWDLFAGYGLIGGDIRFLLAGGSSDLYAATKSGVFRFEGLRWQELSLGLYAGEVNSLALDSPGNLYAACARGLFKMVPEPSGQKEGKDLFSIYARGEPEINEV
ncbi:MAG: hypothetical protein JW788_00385, partial [Candidatus Omnitrophica bacterium]|nr:hypothetical protein [Candidatus Omnitrophota bacterium]